MNALQAKKIVNRVQSGKVYATSYRQTEVEDAFRVLKVELTADHLKPWTDALAVKVVDPVDQAARQEANRQRIAANLAAKAAQRQDRAERIRQAQIRAIRAQPVIAENIQGGELVSPEDVAVAAGRAAFEQVTQTGVVITPLEPETPVPPVSETPNLSGKTVAELRAFAKEKGLKGTSTMKKDEIIALLTNA